MFRSQKLPFSPLAPDTWNQSPDKARFNLANAPGRQGLTDEAMRHYLEALQIDPDHGDAHYNLANILLSKDQVETAAAHYLDALRIKPGFADAHNNLGIALLRKGDAKGPSSISRRRYR